MASLRGERDLTLHCASRKASDSAHVGVGAISHPQRLGRWLGAAHHHRGLPGHWQHWVRADLSDCGAGGVLRAQSIPDAGDSSH
jgi:hypothetical protein